MSDVKTEIKQLEALYSITRSYGEIASSRMVTSRKQVLLDRDYVGKIDEIFRQVLISYRREILEKSKKRKYEKEDRITFLSHNGKKVAVFFSANAGFYGEIVKKTFQAMLVDLKKHPDTEVTIVGRSGVGYYKQYYPNKQYTYFDMADYGFDEENLSKIMAHLVQYEQIKVYYGMYKSVASQVPNVFDLSASFGGETEKKGKEEEEYKYLFEPSLADILKFFETETLTSIFDQLVREGQLAKFASRIMAMDMASGSIGKTYIKAKQKKLMLEHRLKNSKQLNTLSALYA